MAKRPTVQYVCSNCGAMTTSWGGKCPQCGEWNTLVEQLPLSGISGSIAKGSALNPQSLQKSITKDAKRIQTSIKQIDDIFGGGIVIGSVNLIAGQPGIGKSTLLLQIASSVSKNNPVLYISGEESAHQIGMRAERIGVSSSKLQIVTSNSADDIAATIASSKYSLVIVDSIQTITCSAISSQAGSVSQITNSTQLLVQAAKQSNTALIVVGHVTKEGSIAGPKVLEHLVDVVLQLEGDTYGGFKILRATKNRYGSTDESGIFEMVELGLRAVDNPSAALLSERMVSDGSIVLATMEGTRPLLVEVQALVNKTSFGYPKRAASGFDLTRLNLLVAMMERRTKLSLSDSDIYINIAGGIQVREPAADLAICMAIGSAAKGFALKQDAVVFGEVGLSGEVRQVTHTEKRIAEAKKLGFKSAIGPEPKKNKLPGLNGVTDIKSALNNFLVKG
ncbi:MAG: DNA repair protein RadA [Candidatus Saccharimonadales bacterium]